MLVVVKECLVADKDTIKRAKKQKNFDFSEREYLRGLLSKYD